MKLKHWIVSKVDRFISLHKPREIPKEIKAENKKSKPNGVVADTKPILEDYVKTFKQMFAPEKMVKKITLLPEGIMSESGVKEYEDPVLGKVANARIRSISWIKGDTTGKKLVPVAMGYGREMREAWKEANDVIQKKQNEMREAYAEKWEKAGHSRESLPVNPSFDLTDVADWSTLGGGNSTTRQNLPFPPGPFTKQMYLQDFWKMNALVFQLFNYSALARRVIEVKVDFILGNGIKVDFEDENLQAGWDEFEDRVGWYSVLKVWLTQWRKYGELFVQPFLTDYDTPMTADEMGIKKKKKPKVKAESDKPIDENKTDDSIASVTKKLNVRSIDNSTIWDYVTNPEDIYEVYGYWVQFTTQYQLFTKGTEGKEQLYTEYVMRMMPPDSLIHVKSNVEENEKRGRSDLLAALPMFSYNDDYIRAIVLRAILEATYVWDVEVQTGDDSDVQREAAKEGNFPPPGSSYFHNAAIKRNLTGFSGATGANSGRGEDIIDQVSIATGVPGEFLGQAKHSNKAAALTATAPFTKHIQSCQKELEVLIRKLVKFYATANGKPKAKFEIIFPEIAPADMLQKIQALVLAQTSDYYSKERTSTMVAKELNDTTYDYEEEKEKIDAEKQKAMEDNPMVTALYGEPHKPGGPATPMAPKPKVAPVPGAGIGAGKIDEKTNGPVAKSDDLSGSGIGQ